jgi:Na+-transporting NADH:ubiquinone oxidoreductase subunit NqrB
MSILGGIGQDTGQAFGFEADVDEAGAGDFEWLGQVVELDGFDDRLGNVAGLLLEPLGQTHGSVALIVAKRGITGRFDDWIARFTGYLFDSLGETATQQCVQIRVHAAEFKRIRGSRRNVLLWSE